MPKVYAKDVKPAGLCLAGARAFAKKHNLDYRDFIKNGIDVEVLEKLDPVLLKNIIRRAK